MPDRTADRSDPLTAYDCRDRLPDLRAWMGDDALKQLTLWRGPRLTPNEQYFDLTNPERGPFIATGAEGSVTDRTYVARREMTLRAWTQLVTWCQPVSGDQGGALAAQWDALGIGRAESAADEAEPRPPTDSDTTP